MVNIVVFHSVLGLRPVELGAAERLRAAGHDVVTPDLYSGQTAPDLDEGFALMDRVGCAGLPASACDGLPVQVHVADPDPIAPPAEVTAWRAANPGAEVFTYPGAGHFYTDAEGSGHDEVAAALTWRRVLEFLRTLPGA